MRAIADNGTTHHYIYDASGERVIKSSGDGQAIYINGFPMGGSGTVGNYTMYVNPFMVVQNFEYTKHFYIEGQRIVSKLGEMGIEQQLLLPKSHAGDSLKNPVKWDTKKDLTKDIIIANFEALGLGGAVFTAGKSGKMPYGQIKKYFRGDDVVINPRTPSTTTQKTEDLQFYYHPDHLGSSNNITDASGEVYQHQEYFPFGETFVEERNDAEYTTYLFNGKELDEETGLYYYGARYYDPRVSLWYGVDPNAENYYSWSPYHYAANNPLLIIDPDGRDWYQSTGEDGAVMWRKGNEDIKGYKNIGANYTQKIGNGISINYTQNEATSMTTNTMTSDQWVSQYSKSDWDGTPASKACNKASDAMLAKDGNYSSGMTVVVNNAGDGRAGIANGNAANAISDMSKALDFDKPTKVNVDFRSGTGSGDKMGDHFVVVQGKTEQLSNGKVTSTFFHYFDPGTSHQSKGTSSSNILRVQNNRLVGTHMNNGLPIVVTSIRPTK